MKRAAASAQARLLLVFHDTSESGGALTLRIPVSIASMRTISRFARRVYERRAIFLSPSRNQRKRPLLLLHFCHCLLSADPFRRSLLYTYMDIKDIALFGVNLFVFFTLLPFGLVESLRETK